MGQGWPAGYWFTERRRADRGEAREPEVESGTPARHGGARYPKKGRRVLCQEPRVKYQFIEENRHDHCVMVMCRVLQVSRSGYYAWIDRPLSVTAEDNQRLVVLIRASHTASEGILRRPTFRAPPLLAESWRTGDKLSIGQKLIQVMHGRMVGQCLLESIFRVQVVGKSRANILVNL